MTFRFTATQKGKHFFPIISYHFIALLVRFYYISMTLLFRVERKSQFLTFDLRKTNDN